jgi:hypothetical protein
MFEFPNPPAIAEFDPPRNEIAVDVERAPDVDRGEVSLAFDVDREMHRAYPAPREPVSAR